MAKVTMPMRLPDANERTAIATEAAKGSDAFLPARDRRSRAQISPTTNIPAGVSVFSGRNNEYTMYGPGRGEGWAIVMWIDDDGSRCYATYHESQLTTVRPA